MTMFCFIFLCVLFTFLRHKFNISTWHDVTGIAFLFVSSLARECTAASNKQTGLLVVQVNRCHSLLPGYRLSFPFPFPTIVVVCFVFQTTAPLATAAGAAAADCKSYLLGREGEEGTRRRDENVMARDKDTL
ncbi:hypothetical protein FOCC_FOCC014633 [Frankliniella occidentalis]|nr:hypothetical protein FOCC_FOCC014633 [Frankliniella occidentalis]